MDDFGGFSLFGGDTPDYGTSWDFGSGFDLGGGYGGSDLMSQFNLGVSPTLDTNMTGGGSLYGGFNSPPMGAPTMQQPPMIPGMGSMGGINSLQGLLGVGAAGAGLLGTALGGGVTGRSTPQIPTAARAQLNQSNQALQPFALGQTPLQMQQASMLQALSQGQIPQGYADLVARAYDPAYQDVARRATDAGRQAGFYDAPMSSPVGGAIVGPAAAALQGQQANSLLSLMQSLPGLFNQPIATQAGAAGNQSNNLLRAAGAQMGQTNSAPLAPQIGQAVGAGLQGFGQSVGQNQQMAQQQQFQNSLLRALGGQQQGPYQFGGYSGL